MKLTIPAFDKIRVLVVGDLMLDRYWHGPTSRISPEAPVPVVRVDEIEERPGGAGNVAINIATLGGQCGLMGLTGDDEAADALEKRLTSSNVNCFFTRLKNNPTITKLRVISRHQQLIRLDFEDGFEEHDSSELINSFKAQLEQSDVVICSDYGKGSLRDVESLISMAAVAGKPVLVDPKGSDFNKYRHATLISPNLSEFEAVVGHCRNDEELVERGERLRDELDLQALLITRSEQGMTLLEKGQPAFHIPTRARDVYDVTGAGDTVISVFAAALAAGKSMAESTTLANIAAGVVVGKLGTASVTVHEMQQAMNELLDIEKGVVDEDLLSQLVRDCQARGERVVMTNGCFDILHAGHVTYLEQARQLGDRLIVAVNDDASVKRLKGQDRPVNTESRRMVVLAALGSVDWVVPFTEDTPERLICKVLPDVLVKGGDYRPEDIAGGQCVIDHKGEVKILSFVEG
ncbi:MAG: bifunctional D-glycero-beta-D-manno-heptose-7-phosphate kinase/D-glycero-beta-D-manno-heptose 1-phosphate adenylyltransferase HldE, partial [Gammaproteobacteria bacterium]|nr:bifunctional D-glycero-beta-D-manno-heptose-7-phosphate kinase/D-glycero-beta-D-manno-heptose 1-phosphate adenylyltransferase HldE [Gammaproteobacteria bacterium]